MEEIDDEYILECVERWSHTGLLYGLPGHEKEELAPIFDTVARINLSKLSSGEITRKISDLMDDVMFPICRRLYRRVGNDFDIEKMITELVKKVTENQDLLDKPSEDKHINPIVEFCVTFCDQYTDPLINKKRFSDEEYDERISKMVDVVKNVLLNKQMTSYVDRSNDQWVVRDSESKSSVNGVRLHNQKVAIEILSTIIKDTNRGL